MSTNTEALPQEDANDSMESRPGPLSSHAGTEKQDFKVAEEDVANDFYFLNCSQKIRPMEWSKFRGESSLPSSTSAASKISQSLGNYE